MFSDMKAKLFKAENERDRTTYIFRTVIAQTSQLTKYNLRPQTRHFATLPVSRPSNRMHATTKNKLARSTCIECVKRYTYTHTPWENRSIDL